MSQAGALSSSGSGGNTNLQKIAVQSGTSPVVPNASNQITFNGAAIAAGSTPVITNGTSANTMALQVQTSQAIASTDATKIGLAAFNSADFTVDANGFVTLSGSAVAEEFQVDAHTAPGTNPVVPTAGGLITVTGGQVAAGTTSNVIQTNSLAANTYSVQVQRSQAVASSTVGDNGVCHFSSTDFGVDSNGFVTLASSVPLTFDADSGTATPSANTITINGGTTGLTTTASGSTVSLTGTLKLADGGTNANLTASNGGIFYSTATAGAILSGTATADQVLLSGTSSAPSWSTATYPATTTINQLLYSSSANTITGLATANNGVLITGTTGIPSLLADGTTGQVLTATTGSPPSWSSITTGVSSVTGTANQILASPTTGAVVLSLIGPYTPSTYTAHGVLVGEGTSSITTVGPTATTGQVLQNNSGADPTYSTATYPSTTTINQLLYSSSANTIGGLATANNGVLTTGTGGAPSITALSSDGQLIIGSSAGAPAAATLTAGSNVTITNGHNSITIAASSGSMTWTDESTSFNAAAGNGYFVTGTATATLPASPSQGNTISFIVDTTNILTITANTGQVIRVGSAVSASAGTCANNARGDSITLVYRSSDTAWICLGAPQGTWTVT